MDSKKGQYSFAAFFLAVCIYQLVIGDYLEAVLYAIAGSAFGFNALSLEPKLIAYKKVIVIITWVLIVSGAIIFLYFMQFKHPEPSK